MAAFDQLPQAASDDSSDVQESVWQELEEKQLLGPKTRWWVQHFCSARPGSLWALATLALCIYAVVRPNEDMSNVLGRKVIRVAAAMGGLATASAMFASSGTASFLQSEAFRELLSYEQGDDSPSDWRSHRFDTVARLHLLRRLCTNGILVGLPLSPAFLSDPIYVLAWLLLLGFVVFYLPGLSIVRVLVSRLSRSLVEQMMNNIEAGPESWKGTGQFWQVMTQKHQQMDRMLERAWALAMWFFLPSLANNVIFGVIGLVVCLSAVITSQNALVAFTGLFVICLNVFNFAERLKDMANITQMCMSTTADTRSILTLAIAKSGPSPCSEAGLKTAGYSSCAKERSDHSRFLTYLMANRAGGEEWQERPQ
ncbi:unnamed protein product [Durusdinium trenchii]|uniref:ABC transmembrane type-1 domain-containing protein n=2 Tax=Durusdinium trenchii TaxID=1381693 RepID=A0ABP0M293_9DINO